MIPMNIEIITIISYNYGNRLQNYAMQAYLEKHGFRVQTSRRDTREEPLYENHHREWRVVTDAETMKCYRAFDDHIHWKEDLLSHQKDDANVDFYIAGSDQLWNPCFEDLGGAREFLKFTNPEKRLAFSASIGVSQLPAEKEAWYREGLLGIEQISMREFAGAEIVEHLTGKKPLVTLDPTMLLTAQDWEPIAETSAVKISEDYIVKYFLGITNPEYDAKIEQYAKTHNCKVIDLLNHKDVGIHGIGPAEFLYLMMHSKANFVDSFHGAVFSVLFQKPFLAFFRPSQKEFGDMNSRFDTLFEHFDLHDRFIGSPTEFEKIYEPINYDRIEKILELKRAEAEGYLLKALHIQQD